MGGGESDLGMMKLSKTWIVSSYEPKNSKYTTHFCSNTGQQGVRH